MQHHPHHPVSWVIQNPQAAITWAGLICKGLRASAQYLVELEQATREEEANARSASTHPPSVTPVTAFRSADEAKAQPEAPLDGGVEWDRFGESYHWGGPTAS